MGGLEEEADVKMILPCVGSKLREGSGLLTPELSGMNLGRSPPTDEDESARSAHDT